MYCRLVDWRRRTRSEIEVSCTIVTMERYGTVTERLWLSRYFLDQPLLHPKVTDRHLLAWYFEDRLKKYFFSVLQILEVSYSSWL